MKVKSNILDVPVHKYNIVLETFIEWESRQPGEHIRPPPPRKNS